MDNNHPNPLLCMNGKNGNSKVDVKYFDWDCSTLEYPISSMNKKTSMRFNHVLPRILCKKQSAIYGPAQRSILNLKVPVFTSLGRFL